MTEDRMKNRMTEILYEDETVLVVYKPAGLATQTAKTGRQDVVSELRNYLWQTTEKRAPYLGIIHRLDQPVEGILVFAKDKKTAASLTGRLQSQGDGERLCKRYYAVFCGHPGAAEGELADYLYKNQENRAVVAEAPWGENREAPGDAESSAVRREVPDYGKASARRAVLRYRILEMQGERGIGLAEIDLVTGRFHQIRAQMAHAGMPLLGDLKYGDENSALAAKRLGIRNVALCACELKFRHPVSKREMCFQIKPRGEAFSLFPI